MATQKMSREARNSMRKANNARIKAKKRMAAEARQNERNSISAEEQIARLRNRPGNAEKEISRLLKLL